MHVDEHFKGAADAMAITVTLGTVMEWLPAIAAGLSIIWTMIRIYETRTIQAIINREEQDNGEG